MEGNSNAIEADVDNDGSYSDEDWPTQEPWGKKYLIVKIFNCRAQDEWQLEEWFEDYPVALDTPFLDIPEGCVLVGH